MTIAIFPGSFDPITNGHVETAKKAAKMFDKLYIVIMTNTQKQYMFSNEQKASFIKDALKDVKNIEVLIQTEDLTINVARKLNAHVIVRGLRNTEDFIYEQQIAEMNNRLDPEIETVLFLTSPQNAMIASSMVKEVAKFGGNVDQFLPPRAAAAMKQRYNKQ